MTTRSAWAATKFFQLVEALVSLIGLGINTLILYIFNEKLKWNFYLSKVFATGVVMLWNFFANNFFTFAGV